MKPHTNPLTWVSKVSKGLVLGFGLVAINSPSLLAQNIPPTSPFADGIYLYGQSAQPEQIGKEYMIFKVQQGKVIGAVFLPQSEYSCFAGTLTPQQMRVSVIDPYENATYQHTIALDSPSPVAAERNIAQKIGLEGYYPISTISNNDRQILQTCLDKIR